MYVIDWLVRSVPYAYLTDVFFPFFLKIFQRLTRFGNFLYAMDWIEFQSEVAGPRIKSLIQFHPNGVLSIR